MSYSSKLLFALLSGLPLAAQNLQIQGPTSGLIYDDFFHSIRPILGLAGGAHLGSPIYAGLDYASIAPNGRYALIVQSGQVALIRDLTNPQTLSAMPAGTIVNPNRILWATDSSAAVLCAGGRLQRVTGLDAAPAVEDAIELPSRLKERVVTVAADSSARRIVAGMSGRTGGGVYFVSEYGDVSLLMKMENPSAAAFTQDGQDLYVADRGAQQILVFRNVGPGASGALVLDPSNGISDPVGLASSGGQLIVVEGAPRIVQTYNLPALTPAGEYQLDSQPQGIEPVAASSYFRLTSSGDAGEPVWLLDARTQPSIFFVPRGQ